MIDMQEIFDNAQIESLQSLFNGKIKNPAEDDTLAEANVYSALMEFSLSLLNGYHAALRQELLSHGIEI